MFNEYMNPKPLWEAINQVWAKSLVAALMFFFGMVIGEDKAESRIISDCKYSNVFRVGVQAFNCQRKI